MTLEKTILTNLSDWRPDGRDQLTITDADTSWTVHITADKCDELGCKLWEIALKCHAPIDTATLETWAKKLADCHGLSDKLGIIEIDNGRDQAILRSQNPVQSEQQVTYFEVCVTGTTEAVLRRYHGFRDVAGKRQQIHFVLTHESVGRLVQSMASPE